MCRRQSSCHARLLADPTRPYVRPTVSHGVTRSRPASSVPGGVRLVWWCAAPRKAAPNRVKPRPGIMGRSGGISGPETIRCGQGPAGAVDGMVPPCRMYCTAAARRFGTLATADVAAEQPAGRWPPGPTARRPPCSARMFQSMWAKSSERPPHFRAFAPNSSPPRQSRTATRDGATAPPSAGTPGRTVLPTVRGQRLSQPRASRTAIKPGCTRLSSASRRRVHGIMGCGT